MQESGRGWLVYAAVVLGVAGIMRFFDALWAFSYHGVLPENLEGAVFGHSLKTYGWIWLIVAIILVLSAFAVLAQSQLARWVGIVAGAIAAVTSIWLIPYYPIWALVYIGLGVSVIYALAAYGGRDERSEAPVRSYD
jgi:hypothetical protein